MTPSARRRVGRELVRALDEQNLQREEVERLAVTIDGGLGQAAIAAITARVGDAAKDLEAAVWARRAHARGLEGVAHIYMPGMNADEVDANARLMFAIEQENVRAA